MKNPFYISNTGYEQQQYSLLMSYDNLHNILSKEQLHQKAPGQSGGTFTDIPSTTYRLDYTYEAENKPHAPRIIEDKPYQTSPVSDKKFKNYDYDPNGNLTNITQTTGESDVVEKLRTNLWDEENRLRAVDITPDAEGIRPIAIYTYDAGGERILKHSNTSVSIYLNGKKVADTIQTNAMLYPSGMLVAKLGNNGSEEEQTLAYTKHYFAGTQRVSSKIGTTENLGDYLYDWFTSGTGGPIDVVGSSFGVLENAEDGVVQVYTELGIDPPTYESNPVFIPVQSFVHGGNEVEQYFFHPDHLGSTSYITNLLGEVSQHMEYFAFGETFVEEHRSSKNSPYKFNGKELDEETGWYYYGARYYDPRISVWLSVDPLAEETMTPYQYTYQNPIRFIDPTGMAGEDWFKLGKDGHLTKIKSTQDNYDIIFKEDQIDSNFPLSTLFLNEEVGYKVNDKTLLPQFESRIPIANNSREIRSSNNKEVLELFYFFSDNSDVEYSYTSYKNISTGDTFSSLYTSYEETTVRGFSAIRDIIMMNFSITQTRDLHNHPGEYDASTGWPAYPSGFNVNLKPTVKTNMFGEKYEHGDRGYYNAAHKKYGNRVPDYYEVYIPSAPNISVKYNGKKVIRK